MSDKLGWISSELRWFVTPIYQSRYFSIIDEFWLMESPLQLLPLLNEGITYIRGTKHFYPKFITYKNGSIKIGITLDDLITVSRCISINQLEQFIIDGIVMYDKMQKL